MRRIIGIDPGSHTGVAICEMGKLVKVYETDFWGAIDAINEADETDFVIIEMPTSKHVWHNEATNKKAIQRTGVNVGSALREAELLITYLVKNNIKHCVQKPMGKLDKDQFKKLTGWTQRTNQHMRDSAVLCYRIK